MRLVLDTNVVVSALLWDGVPRRLLQIGRQSAIAFYSSTPLLLELTEVLLRPKFQTKIATSALSVDELVDLYAELALLVKPVSVPRTAPDPDDDVVIATALAARADFIVTGDKGLMSVYQYEGGRIVSVSDALLLIGKRQGAKRD